jgi:hypothetical protein
MFAASKPAAFTIDVPVSISHRIMFHHEIMLSCLFLFAQEVKRLGRAVALSSVAVFGGSGVANQISELKRGTEVRCGGDTYTRFSFISFCAIHIGSWQCSDIARLRCMRFAALRHLDA